MMHLIQEGILSIDQHTTTAKPSLNYINTEMIKMLKLEEISRMDLIEAGLRQYKFYDSEDFNVSTKNGIDVETNGDISNTNKNQDSDLIEMGSDDVEQGMNSKWNNKVDMWSFLLGRNFANFKDRSDFIFKHCEQELFLHIKVHKLERGRRLFVLVSDISRIKELETIEFKLMRIFFSSVAHELRTPLNSIIPMS